MYDVISVNNVSIWDSSTRRFTAPNDIRKSISCCYIPQAVLALHGCSRPSERIVLQAEFNTNSSMIFECFYVKLIRQIMSACDISLCLTRESGFTCTQFFRLITRHQHRKRSPCSLWPWKVSYTSDSYSFFTDMFQVFHTCSVNVFRRFKIRIIHDA